MKPILYYIHDPMCSWCWGFSRVLTELLGALPKEIEVQRLLGGLAPDSDLPMPEELQESIKSNWRRIEDTIPNVKFNYDFWTKNIPRRSTYPACRAVIAARVQGEKYDVLMTEAIQRAYYQEARNPSDYSTHIELAAEIGLEIKIFEEDCQSHLINEKLNKEIMLSREMFIESYPSLALDNGKDIHRIDINYLSYEKMREQITSILGYANTQGEEGTLSI